MTGAQRKVCTMYYYLPDVQEIAFYSKFETSLEMNAHLLVIFLPFVEVEPVTDLEASSF